ncbi:SRPBCC family protein [Pseudonocardia xishanensis]|uniref:SRPBCC family protein n=1 Tax=Pseudonocardia xishanensis TaxID=630995 RepID=A0ABP8RTY0_9PSEU
MAQVTATAEKTVPAPVDAVIAAVADYATTRPRILTEEYTDYAVLTGGLGDGTSATWKLHATRKRTRHVKAEVTQPTPDTVVETDLNSSMVTTWRVAPAGEGAALVSITTTWNGAGGIGGFFEKTFAPKGLARIYGRLLDNLASTVSS